MPDKIASVNGIQVCYETLGNPSDAPIILMMGNSAQSIMWPDAFCEQLVNSGRYVIRFDYRDTGLSSCIDYEANPYTLFDLVNDVLGLMDVLKLEKAHFVGLSMGGSLAQLLAIYHQERVLSITLMMTSADLSVKNDAFKGKDTSKAVLPPPKAEFVKAIIALNSTAPINRTEKIQQQVENWRLANGNKVPFDEKHWYDLIEQALMREELNPTAKKIKFANHSNHTKAQAASSEPNLSILEKIKVPTLVIHGDEDPIFPLAHAQAVADTVVDAKLLSINGMGHALNAYYFDQIVSAITKHT